RQMTMKKAIFRSAQLLAPIALAMWFAASAHAAAPGITTTGTFQLVAAEAYLNQPDGQAIYSWGYGCKSGFTPTFLPSTIAAPAGACTTMQVPGPTLIVTEGQPVTVTLTNNLPTAA